MRVYKKTGCKFSQNHKYDTLYFTEKAYMFSDDQWFTGQIWRMGTKFDDNYNTIYAEWIKIGLRIGHTKLARLVGYSVVEE